MKPKKRLHNTLQNCTKRKLYELLEPKRLTLKRNSPDALRCLVVTSAAVVIALKGRDKSALTDPVVSVNLHSSEVY
jgi:hypothetical protein